MYDILQSFESQANESITLTYYYFNIHLFSGIFVVNGFMWGKIDGCHHKIQIDARSMFIFFD